MEKEKFVAYLKLQRKMLHGAGVPSDAYHSGLLDGQLEMINYLLFVLENGNS